MASLKQFLCDFGLEHYAPLFADNHIAYTNLAELSLDDMREIGVTSLGRRKHMQATIAARRLIEKPVVATTPSVKRREVTTLYADLPGYTKLSQELGAEDMYGFLTTFYHRFDLIIRRLGGTVDRHIGDSVMAVFGAPVSYGNDAEHAAGGAGNASAYGRAFAAVWT